MYPGFAKTARDEGFDEIAEWFETLARGGEVARGRFSSGLSTFAVSTPPATPRLSRSDHLA
jgi:rubrerythrin